MRRRPETSLWLSRALAGKRELMLRLVDLYTMYARDSGPGHEYLEQKLAFLANRLDVSYALIVPGRRNRLEVRGRARRYWVKGPVLPGTSGRRVIAGLSEVRRVLCAEMPHVIEVGSPQWAPWLPLAASRGLKARLVGFWHDPGVNDVGPRSLMARSARTLGAWAARRYTKAAHNRFDAVFAASEAVAERLTRQSIAPVFPVRPNNGNWEDALSEQLAYYRRIVGRLPIWE